MELLLTELRTSTRHFAKILKITVMPNKSRRFLMTSPRSIKKKRRLREPLEEQVARKEMLVLLRKLSSKVEVEKVMTEITTVP